MRKTFSFRFLNDDLNRRLVDLAAKIGIAHSVDRSGAILFRIADEERVESEVIAPVREFAFRDWQVLSCPPDALPLYRDRMALRGVPFVEESMDGEVSFLLPGRYRPHSWKLQRTAGKSRLSRVG